MVSESSTGCAVRLRHLSRCVPSCSVPRPPLDAPKAVVSPLLHTTSHAVFLLNTVDPSLFRYTRNGELLGDGFVPVYESNLVPVVGFHSNGESVRINFGLVPFAYEVSIVGYDEEGPTLIWRSYQAEPAAKSTLYLIDRGKLHAVSLVPDAVSWTAQVSPFPNMVHIDSTRIRPNLVVSMAGT